MNKIKMTPKISVIMSVYNGQDFLQASVKSILNQTCSDFEFLIVDDASTDSSPVLLEGLAKSDNRIKIIKNQFNLGLTKSLNLALDQARGQYIARLDADDLAYPDRLKHQLDFLENNPDYVLLGTAADVIDDNCKVLFQIKPPTESEKIVKSLIKFNPFIHSSIMFRKSIVDLLGGYDSDLKYAQDYELYFRLINKGLLGNLSDVLVAYRDRQSSITAQKNRSQIKTVLKVQIRALYKKQYPIKCLVYLIKPILFLVFPLGLRRGLKRLKYFLNNFFFKNK